VAPYQWVIEGDIKGCFDHIDHHRLMHRVRARIGDLKVTRLTGQFLKAGVLEAGFLLPTREGTPQGGVISPLLANIALSAIEERYERWVHHRTKIRAHRTSDGLVRPNWKVWREKRTEQFLLTSLSVQPRFRRGWMSSPAFACVPGEPDA
jgi:retron-type reverse transcriptase